MKLRLEVVGEREQVTIGEFPLHVPQNAPNATAAFHFNLDAAIAQRETFNGHVPLVVILERDENLR